MPVIKRIANDLGAFLNLDRVTLTTQDFTAAALTQTIPLFTAKKGAIILAVRIKPTTLFAGTGWTGATLSVGSASNGATGYATALSLLNAVADTNRQVTVVFKDPPNADEAINAYVTTVGGNISAITAGRVDIDVLYLLPSTPGL